MKTSTNKGRFGVSFCLVVLATGLLMSVFSGTAAAKGLFVCSEHHESQFDAWNINPAGTITKQATYGLTHATDPAGIAIDSIDPHAGTMIFITSEFSGGIEIVEVPPVGTPISYGYSSGPSDLAGVAVDSVNDIVYSIKRRSNQLYIYDWDSSTETLTQRPAVISLPGCSGGFGIALDETTDTLWVADTSAGVARAYDISTWTQTGASFTPSHKPMDIIVDRPRQLVHTVSMATGASVPSGSGSHLLSTFDLTARTEQTTTIGHQGVGVGVDEVSGFVYISGGYSGSTPIQNLEVWDPGTTPATLIQATGDIGRPAGLAIANTIVNPLHLAKDDVIVGEVYIGSTFTFAITCDNLLNTTFPAENVTILDTLPPELDFISATHGGAYDSVAHTVFWDIGTIPAGGTGPVIDLVVKVNRTAIPGSTIYNHATIEGTIAGVDLPPATVVEGEGTEEEGTPIGESILVSVDIKPTSCPNPFNVKSNGVLPVAILGTEDFDVTQIDVATILLAGVAPLRSNLEDVATPVPDNAAECQCTKEGPDGYLDLALKFDTQAIAAALGVVSNWALLELPLTGSLMECYGGIPIQGSDCVRILKLGK